MVMRPDPDKEFGWAKRPRRTAATFGLPKGSCKPHTPEYLKKREGDARRESRKPANYCGLQCSKAVRKPLLDMASPVLPEQVDKDFIKCNAMSITHEQPRAVPCNEAKSIDKPDYGKVPKYLKAAKLKLQQDRAAKEEETRVALQQGIDARMTVMPDGDKQELLKKLKRQWGALNAAYQKLPLQLDTPSKKHSKEMLETSLVQCESDIQLLQLRPQVVIMH